MVGWLAVGLAVVWVDSMVHERVVLWAVEKVVMKVVD